MTSFFGRLRLVSNRQCDIGRIQLALNLWNVRKSIPIISCSQKRLAAVAALWANGAMGHKYEVLKLLCINYKITPIFFMIDRNFFQ